MEANKKLKLKLFESGIKSNSKNSAFTIGLVPPLASLKVCKKKSPEFVTELLKFTPVYGPCVKVATPFLMTIPSEIGKVDPF